MTSRFRHVAPAGAPIRTSDLARWIATTLSSGDAAQALRQAVRSRFGVRHSFPICTGRAGMTVLLRSMRRLAPPDRDEVILPSYTCYSVAASIVKAGLRPHIVDISPETLDFAPDTLGNADFSRVLAVVATNLYGQPNDLPSISRVAKAAGVFLIDDAAQAMGASVDGRWCGTWGDAGLFSFDKGKNVSAIDGGIVVTGSSELAKVLEDEVSSLPSPNLVESAKNAAKLAAYFVMLRPWLYWIPNRIPQLSLGKTVFTTDFPLERPDRSLASLALTMLPRLDEFTRAREANALAYLDALQSVSGIQAVRPRTGTVSAWLRLPVLFADPAARDRAVDALQRAGIGASASYPESIADIPDLQAAFAKSAATADGGRYVARRIATLPTHPFVNADDIGVAVATIAAAIRGRDAGVVRNPAPVST